jgi:hypothetical protein
MNKHDLSIATITWARDADEEKLLRQSLQQLAKLELPVFITDGGSNNRFLDFIRSFPNFTLLEAKARGLWAQAKNSLSAAHQSGSPFILYTEPDKNDFFKNGLPQNLQEVVVNERSGIITASRSTASFATFPAFQQMTETTINNCCNEVISSAIDYTYGPFILNRQLVPYFALLQEDIGWGWRPYTFVIANRLSYTIEAFTGHFSCPPAQQQDNRTERIYRMRQLSENIQGIVLAATVQLNGVPPVK